jgi:outer membrane protein OmpA-like peptidoglycan-associated protein
LHGLEEFGMLLLLPFALALAPPVPLLPEAGKCTPGEAQLYFGLGAVRPDAAEDALLARIASGVAREPESYKVTIVGHSDTIGASRLNLDLSKRRADLAALRLVALGVPRDRIEVRGVGEAGPAIHTLDNRAEPRNRRVAIRVEPVVDLKKVFAGGDPSPPPMC